MQSLKVEAAHLRDQRHRGCRQRDAAVKKAGAKVVIVQPSPFTFRERERIVAAATNQGVATIFLAFRPAAANGVLLTYGPNYGDLNRRAAGYLARILKGTPPGDLPVEQPTKFELFVNLKTAKAVGLTVPPSLIYRRIRSSTDARQATHVMDLLQRITRDPTVIGGRPCIRGMRVTVGTILGLLAAGRCRRGDPAGVPYLEADDIRAALSYAASYR